MPEAEIGVEQLVDELLQYIVLQDSLSTSPNKPWKVGAYLVVFYPHYKNISSQYLSAKFCS